MTTIKADLRTEKSATSGVFWQTSSPDECSPVALPCRGPRQSCYLLTASISGGICRPRVFSDPYSMLCFKYSLVNHLTGHMVTAGVGQTQGHMGHIFQWCHFSQSFLSVLSVFIAKNQMVNFWHFECDECSKCMKQVGMFMSVGVKSLTIKCKTSHKSAVLITKS